MISARTASAAAASGPRAHKSDASRKTLRSLLQKKGQIRMIAAAGGGWGGGRGMAAAAAAGTPRWTNYTLAQVYKYRKYCLHNHSKYITTGTENYTNC